MKKNNTTGGLKVNTDELIRGSYLHSRNVPPKDSHQLDLLFPVIANRNDLRHIPNDYARSSLFTAKNKREPRRQLIHERLFHYNDDIEILYTGVELRAEDDELVWLQILNFAQRVPLGEPFEFSVKDIVADIGWPRNGRYYDRVRTCISRLKANEVLALNKRAYGKSGSISLIQNYSAVNNASGKPTHYRAWIDRNLIVLFAGNTFTSHRWESYKSLSPVARRLADYVESHQHPYPLALDKFQGMCGSIDKQTKSWRETVRRACQELEKCGVVKAARLDQNDKIACVK